MKARTRIPPSVLKAIEFAADAAAPAVHDGVAASRLVELFLEDVASRMPPRKCRSCGEMRPLVAVSARSLCCDCEDREVDESCSRAFVEREQRASAEREAAARRAALARALIQEPEKGAMSRYGSPYLQLMALRAAFSDETARALAAMPYPEFLGTLYWSVVRKNVLTRSRGRCSICNAPGYRLHAHHRTYEHHGREHEFLDDLVALCASCHATHHGKARSIDRERLVAVTAGSGE